MGDRTGIAWTQATWNPTIGCTRVSPGCENCYAIGVAHRFSGTTNDAYKGTTGFRIVGDMPVPDWSGRITFSDKRLLLPLRWKRPRRIFVNSMSDLFHKDIPDAFIAEVFAVMAMAPQHTFQVLTKRHGRMRSLLNDEDFRAQVTQEIVGLEVELGRQFEDPDDFRDWWPLRNVWLGVSVEDQLRADLRIPALMKTPAAVRFLSCEPLLGHVDLSQWTHPHEANCQDEHGNPPWCTCGRDSAGYLDWVIAGGESGRDARPMHPTWLRLLRNQCNEAGIPFLFKQWGEWAPPAPGQEFSTLLGRAARPPAFLLDFAGNVHCTLGAAGQGARVVLRVGKKAAGRDLDGRTWDEYPAAVNA